MTSWPVLPPISSRTTTSAISSGVTNSICSPVVIALNSSSEKMPFSPVSMKTLCSVWPVECPWAGSSGRNDWPGVNASGSPGVVEDDRAPAAHDLAVADALPGDGRGRLDLLRDRPARRARHQEEEQRVRARQSALREQHARGLLLRVRVGDVQAHAAGAGGADLDVGPGARAHHGLVEQLHVADQLRHGVGGEQHLQRLAQVFALPERLPGLAARLVDVLVGDARGRVHAVHDDVGPLGGDEPVQVVLGGGLLGQRVEQALDQA